jgi:tetratricopeptide (TPR) repeat protein
MRRALLALLIAAPCLAQAPAPPPAPPAMPAAPPAPAQLPHAAPAKPLDQMLAALKAAPDEQVAALLEERIEHAWLAAGSPAVTLLMSRGLREMSGGAQADAEQDFSAALDLDPDLAAAYDQRAIARYDQGDTNGAVADLGEVLKRDPRHFDALQTLSRIAESRGDYKAAFEAWTKVLEIDPKTPDGTTRLNILRKKAFGEET